LSVTGANKKRKNGKAGIIPKGRWGEGGPLGDQIAKQYFPSRARKSRGKNKGLRENGPKGTGWKKEYEEVDLKGRLGRILRQTIWGRKVGRVRAWKNGGGGGFSPGTLRLKVKEASQKVNEQTSCKDSRPMDRSIRKGEGEKGDREGNLNWA